MPLDTGVTTLPPLHHMSVVVEDLEKTSQLLSTVMASLGLGSWQAGEVSLDKDATTVGGTGRLKEARAKLGPVVLELIQPVTGRTVWAEFLETHGEGLHHLAFIVAKYDEMVAGVQEHGGEIVFANVLHGKRSCYLETRPGGLIVKFEEKSKDSEAMLEGAVTATLASLRHVGMVVESVDETTELLFSTWVLGPWQPQQISIGKDDSTEDEPSGSNQVQAKKDNMIVGEPCRLKEAHTNLEPIVLELIQPLEGRSVWSEFLETKGEGLQHIAFSLPYCGEMVAKLQEHSCKMIEGAIYDGKFAGYFEINPGGIILELAEPGIHDEQVKDLS